MTLVQSPEVVQGIAMLDKLVALAAKEGVAKAQASRPYEFCRRTLVTAWLIRALETVAESEGFAVLEGGTVDGEPLWHVRAGTAEHGHWRHNGDAATAVEALQGLARGVLGQVPDPQPAPPDPVQAVLA